MADTIYNTQYSTLKKVLIHTDRAGLNNTIIYKNIFGSHKKLCTYLEK